MSKVTGRTHTAAVSKTSSSDVRALGHAWQKRVVNDEHGPHLPDALKARVKFPKSSDAYNRYMSLKSEQGLFPTTQYQDKKTGTFAFWSQTENESDARVYVFDRSGKEVWRLNVGDDGTVSGAASKGITVAGPAKGGASYLGNAALLEQLKTGVGKSRYTNDNWVEVPANRFSQTWNPKESAKLPEALVRVARHMDRAGQDATVSKLTLNGKAVYVLHTEHGWERDASQNLYSDQKAWLFDPAGNLLASGARRINTAEYPDVHNTREAVAPYKWDARAALPA